VAEDGSRILVIEDDRSVGRVVQVSLGLAGHEVQVATDAVTGEVALRRDGHDLVILDINLPGGTGLDLLRCLREDLGRRTPVIMLSGQKQEDSIVRALEWGANDYVTKPFSPRELLARVNRWTDGSGHVAQAQ
jgi:two-component system, OmpR family, phosphate regulon response regulator PhoB